MARKKKDLKSGPPPGRGKPTPKDQGLHAVSLILSEDLYEGLRHYSFRSRTKYQHVLRKLLGEFLATKGIVRVIPGEEGEDDSYELLPPPGGGKRSERKGAWSLSGRR